MRGGAPVGCVEWGEMHACSPRHSLPAVPDTVAARVHSPS